VVADFNSDGTPDLGVLSSGSVFLLKGNGDGTFTPFTTSIVLIRGTGASAIATGDFNRDGKIDIAVSLTSQVSVLLGNGDGTFKAQSLYSAATHPKGMTVSDLNGDGKLDIAVADNDSSLFDAQIPVLLAQANGTFANTSSPVDGCDTPPVTSVVAADLN